MLTKDDDHTREFTQMLSSNHKWPDFAPGIGILADRNWGKSCQEFMVLTLMIAGNPSRMVKFYKAPEELLVAIKKSFPKDFSKHFGIINDIWDAHKNDIISIDEAGVVLDGKEALTKEQREFIKGLTYARHHHSPVVWCTVHPGVSKNLHVLTEIKIFRHMGWDYVKALVDSKEKFANKYSYILQRLPIEKALFRANYKYFRDAKNQLIYEGGLHMPKDKFCPWFTQEISENMGSQSLASERSRDMEQKLNLDHIVNEVLKYYGDELKKGCRNAYIHGWFQRHRPEEYQRYQRYIKDIGYQALNKLFEMKQRQITIPVREVIHIPKVKSIDDQGFSDFLEKFYIENLPTVIEFNQKTSFEKETLIDVLVQWSMGLGQRSIDVPSNNRNKRIPIGIIGQILKNFKNGNGIIQDDLRLYRVYEHWIAKITGGIVLSGIGNPDILYTIHKKQFPGECKLYDDKSVSIAIDKTKKLKPSLDYCKEYNIPIFPFFFRNVKWGDVDYLFEIFVDGPDLISVKKLDENVMEEFNSIQFYNVEEMEV